MAQAQPVSQSNVEHTVREIWATRPHRRASERKIAGVAAALGRRYAIDPVLVRVAFVVATLFSGVGVLLYLLGWLLLPAEDDGNPAAKGGGGRRNSMSAALTILLVLLLFPAAALVFGEGRATGVLGFVVALGALVLLHRSRAALGEIPGSARDSGLPGQPAGAAAAAQPAGTAGVAQPPDASAPGNPASTEVATQPAPPAWDPLGAAPFAWDLPEPAPPPAAAPVAHAHRSKVTPITLGLALLVGGLAAAFWPTLPAAQLSALLLGVVGLGLVVGSLVHGGRGLILVAIPLALLTWALQEAPVSGFATGAPRWHPLTASEVQPRYELTMGQGRLDLSDLRLVGGQTVATTVAVGFGETHVILPPDVPTQVSCHAEYGDVNCLGATDSGHPAQVVVPASATTNPVSGRLLLNVQTGFGHIHVERG